MLVYEEKNHVALLEGQQTPNEGGKAYLRNDEVEDHAGYAMNESKQDWEVPPNMMEEDAIEEVANGVQ